MTAGDEAVKNTRLRITKATGTVIKTALGLICKKCRIVGLDLVELAPNLDQSGISTALACKLLRELLLAIDTKQ